MSDDRLSQYSSQRLAGRRIPDDLRTLLLLQWQRGDSAADPLSSMGVRLFEAGETHPLLDHSYLNDADRADPDIMANVTAMISTCEHAAFVAQAEDDQLFGYWFGPENVSIDTAPILKLDSEGQFSLLAGRTLSEALVGVRAFTDQKMFTQLKGSFRQAGIAIGADSWDELARPKAPTDPGTFHEQRYEDNRTRAGLPPYR
jgi:hypothetical protein